MNIDRNKSITIAEHYGFAEQSNQCIEECAELIQALNKHRRAVSHASDVSLQSLITARSDVLGEIADVLVVIDQLIYLLNAVDDVNSVIEFKQNRTIDKMRGGTQ